MKNFKRLKRSIVIASLCAISFCVILITSCPNNDTPDITDTGDLLPWVFDMECDRNPNKFAPGISTLEGWEYCPDGRYAQTVVMETTYVWEQPATGWHLIETGADGIKRVVTEDARGYDTDFLWPHSKGGGEKLRMKVPVMQTTVGPRGDQVQAIRMHGIMAQVGSEDPNAPPVERTGVFRPENNPLTDDSDATDYRRSAGWPSVVLYATPPRPEVQPDQETHRALRDGYGFTFWVRPMKEFVAYRVGLENWDYRYNEGHEPGHWYGARPGRDGSEGINFTPAPVGVWTQVRVIYCPFHPEFNMAVNNWTLMYNIQTNYPGDREPVDIMESHSTEHTFRLAFALQLQHNGGNEGTDWTEYSVISGRHEFDLWFYGLRILTY
jgi:hypothetical protein